jgi:ribokinase
MKPTILVVGSINMDLVIKTPHLPEAGETVLGSSFHTFPGGKGANQAIAVSRLGAGVSLVGRVGDDAFGKTLASILEKEGVSITYLEHDPVIPSGVAVILVDGEGQNSIVVASGANSRLTPQDVRLAGRQIPAISAVIAQLEIPLECVVEAARAAKLRKAPFIFNPAPAGVFPRELLEMVDVLVPNEPEAAMLSAMPVETLEQAEIAGRHLLAAGAGSVIITLGGQGALVVQRHAEAVHIPAHPVNVMDTTAAGDAFTAGLAVGLAEGMSLVEAARLGNASGALAVTRLGALPSLPERSQVAAMLQSQA